MGVMALLVPLEWQSSVSEGFEAILRQHAEAVSEPKRTNNNSQA